MIGFVMSVDVAGARLAQLGISVVRKAKYSCIKGQTKI